MDAHPPPPEEIDTQRLARAAARGEGDPLTVLYERLAPALYTWADFRIRPSLRTWIEPADLVQEVWCRALLIFERYDAERVSFRYWIFRVAKIVLLEATRKVGAAEGGALPAGSTARQRVLDDVPDAVAGVSRRLARSEAMANFSGWIEALEGEDRELLLHHGLEGMPHAQVGVRLGLSEEAVGKRWQRLRTRLEDQALPRELLAALST
jgi:RNA polymerase sigma factor (sigma-70 family)